MPYSAYCLFFVPPNKRLVPVLCSIGKWLIGLVGENTVQHTRDDEALIFA